MCAVVNGITTSSARLPHRVFSSKLNYIEIKLEFVVVVMATGDMAITNGLIGIVPFVLMFSEIFCKNIKYINGMNALVTRVFLGHSSVSK